MRRERTFPWTRIRPYRALLRGQGVLFAVRSSADCVTNMSGFDWRQAQALIGGKLLAEPGVAIAVGIRRPVLLPKQRWRHALALERLRHSRPLGLVQVLRGPPDLPE